MTLHVRSLVPLPLAAALAGAAPGAARAATITVDTDLRGPSPQLLVIDGDGLYRLLNFDTAGGGWLGVEQLTLSHGRSPGGSFGDGGGAYVGGGENAYFHRVFFVENHSGNGGGGLAIGSAGSAPSSATVLECTFQGNVAEGPRGGGGLALIGTDGVARVVRSTVADNHASHENGSGGGIIVTRGTLLLESATVSGNRASDGGGGIRLLVSGAGGTGTLSVRDSTITENLANADGDLAGEGGGVDFAVGAGLLATLELGNSALAGNLDSGTLVRPDVNCGGDVQLAASGFVFLGSNEGCNTLFAAGSPNAAGDWVGSAGAELDPDLLPLGDYGGPTPTHAPFVSPTAVSPLIDLGSCPNAVADQRGFGDSVAGTRRLDSPLLPNPPGGDGCDIGAVEAGGDPVLDPTIFADGFEAGHTLLWSSEVP